MNTTFIYALCDPRTLEVRYVGKSDDPYKRYCRHLIDKRPCYRVTWIQSLLKLGLLPIRQILEECDNYIWEERERNWINYYKNIIRANLTNGTDGGDGFRGGKHSEEAREKISAHNFRRGKRLSEMDKDKIRKAQLGKPHPHRGQIFSIESRAKMKSSALKRWNALSEIEKEKVKQIGRTANRKNNGI